LAAQGIHDPRVLEAMRRVPRHIFLHFTLWARAYEDVALPTLHGQTISQPYMVASMTQLLAAAPEHRVLEIGTGSGYQTMILALLAREVVSIEREKELAQQAQLTLQQFEVNNVNIHVGDGSLGHPPAAPYDRILVTAGSPDVPQALLHQLADGGRMVIPVGDRKSQTLLAIDRNGEKISRRTATECRFVPLVGEQGWPAGSEG
ncbi:MAG: protein-L-isoaspartate(D-aspartate) O-methyltransferase, partial [Phycisphaeraceae bacterium]